MAIRPLNSINGFSVGDTGNVVVYANLDIVGNTITADSNLIGNGLLVNGVSNLSQISNVKIFGGSSGQAVTTDGSGNLYFSTLSNQNSAAPMPYYVPTGNLSVVPEYYQGLFSQTIEIDGTFEVDGVLIQITDTIDASNSQVLFSDNGTPTGNSGFTFNAYTGNLNVPGSFVGSFSPTGSFIPSVTDTYDLGSASYRWRDLYLTGNSIYLGSGTISTDANGALSLLNASGGQLVVAGNSTLTTLENGSSNITITLDGNVTTSVGGNAAVFTVSSTGSNIFGTLSVSGNATANAIKTDNYLYANGVPISFTGEPVGPNTSIQFNNNGDFGGTNTFTFDSSANVLSLTGDLTVTGNVAVTNNLSLSNSSAININGSPGTAGQVLKSNGTKAVWSTQFYYGDTPPDFNLLNYGDIFFYIDNPNNFQRLYMWVTDGTSDYFYDFLPPSF